jgi:putative oxidoreductase
MNSKFTSITRVLLGMILLLSGVNKFFNFIPAPDLPENAANFMQTLGETGYVMPVVGVFEVMIALMLLAKKWVAFALILLAPISINIILFHLFLDLPGISGAILIVILNGILIYKRWSQYTLLFE